MNGVNRRKPQRRRRRGAIRGAFSQKGLTNMVTQDLVPVTAGYVLGQFLPGLLAKISPAAAKYSHYISLGAGAVLGVTQKGAISRAGLGLAANGAVKLIGDLTDGMNGGMGLLPPSSPSYRIAGRTLVDNDVPVSVTVQ